VVRKLDKYQLNDYTFGEITHRFMAKRKKIRTKWKADRKIALAKNRVKKAIRFAKAAEAAKAEAK